jgi:DNA-binding transcriptional ArsR family regulator
MTERQDALVAFGAALDSDLLKALSEPVRVEIIKILIAGGTLDVGQIAEHLPQDRTVISRHVKVLANAGLVYVEKRGRHRYCTLQPNAFIERMQAILTSTENAVRVCCPGALVDD